MLIEVWIVVGVKVEFSLEKDLCLVEVSIGHKPQPFPDITTVSRYLCLLLLPMGHLWTVTIVLSKKKKKKLISEIR